MTITTNIIIIVSVGLILSFALNAILIWYTKESIRKFTFIAENIQDLSNSIEDYSRHLKNVYEMEMFYGDETLKALIDHTRDLATSFGDYDEFYYMFGDEEEQEEQEENEEIEEGLDGTQKAV